MSYRRAEYTISQMHRIDHRGGGTGPAGQVLAGPQFGDQVMNTIIIRILRTIQSNVKNLIPGIYRESNSM